VLKEDSKNAVTWVVDGLIYFVAYKMTVQYSEKLAFER
jgi:hypothetical protein